MSSYEEEVLNIKVIHITYDNSEIEINVDYENE